MTKRIGTLNLPDPKIFRGDLPTLQIVFSFFFGEKTFRVHKHVGLSIILHTYMYREESEKTLRVL